MATGGANQPGQLSADGLWRWDGEKWVPTGAAAPLQARPRGSMAWLWWLLGGCAVLVVIAIIAGIFGLTSLVHNFQGGAYTCLPSDFPKYPNTTVTRVNSSVGTRNQCDVTLTSNDDVSTVTDFYQSHLGEGDWQDTVNSGTGTINFMQVSGGHATGVVQLLGAGQHTEIRITVLT